MKLTNPQAMAQSFFNRYWLFLMPKIRQDAITDDLRQEIYLWGLEIQRAEDLKEAGRELGRQCRRFVKSIGIRKRQGRWIQRDFTMTGRWWHLYETTNIATAGGRRESGEPSHY